MAAMPDTASLGGRTRPAGSSRARTDVLRVLVLLAAFAATFGGLSTILEGVAWWLLCMLLAVLVFGGGLAVRTALPRHPLIARIVGPIAAAVLAAGAIVIRFTADTAILLVVPTAGSFDRFGRLVRDAGYSITWQNVPAAADEPI